MNHNHDVDSWKVDDRQYWVNCFHCGEQFEAQRSDAAFCSAKCRVGHARERKQREKTIQALKNHGVQLRQIADNYRHSKVMFAAMIELRKELNIALSLFEEE